MSADKKLLDYQHSFKKCNPRQVQIGFSMNDEQLSNSNLNSNLNKLSRYSQIRYSKVKPVHPEPDEHGELTCHQENRDDLSLVEESGSESSGRHDANKQAKQVNSCDKLDKVSQSSIAEKSAIKPASGDKADRLETMSTKRGKNERNELQKTPSIRSIDRVDKQATTGRSQPRSIKKHSTNKPHKPSKDSADCKSNPNYDPHYRDSAKEHSVNEQSSLQVTENASKGHSPSSTESSEADESHADHRNLIHPKQEKTMYNLDKLKNKFIDPYSDCSSYLTDDFDEDESDDDEVNSSTRKHRQGDRRSYVHRDLLSSLDSSDGRREIYRSRNTSELDSLLKSQNICSDCKESLRTRFASHGGQRRVDSQDKKFTERLGWKIPR